MLSTSPRTTDSAAHEHAWTPVNTRGDFPLRAFFGHHKCATGWIDGILREVCWRMGLNFRIVNTPRDFATHDALRAVVEDEHVDFLAYTNADATHTADLGFHSGFHVVRDPRDVLVSGYYSHRFSHSTKEWPELEAHREKLNELTKEDGLFLEMEFSRPFFEHMFNWDYEQHNVLELKMEVITKRPREGFREVLAFMDMLETGRAGEPAALRTLTLRMNRLNRTGRRFMPGRLPMFPVPRLRMQSVPESELDVVLEKKSFSRLAGGRTRGEENVHSHYRKGVPDDWKNHLSEDHKAYFKEQYQPLLEKLGYEQDASW